MWHSNDRYKTIIWRCNDKYKPGISRVSGREKCTTPHVTEDEVYGAFQEVVDRLLAQRPEVIEACEQILAELVSTDDLAAREDRLKTEAGRITEKVERLMTKASRETVEGFAEAYGALEAEMNRVTGKLDAVERERKEREFKIRQIKLSISTLGQLEAEKAETVERAEELFLALIDKVVYHAQLHAIWKRLKQAKKMRKRSLSLFCKFNVRTDI